MRLINILLAGWLLMASGLALAIQDIELRNVEDEPRFNELSNVLRCMVCQNQSIADSNAELARDFRNQVKEKINAGQSNDEIVDYMVQRYGDYILYKPPFNVATALLWLGPFLLVIVGFVIIFRILKRQGRAKDEDAQDIADSKQQARLKAMLDNEGDQS
ncbi:MAG: cytochrome c-type biogenesis protein CcmH [Gammaproteobacteria bacterium]|nr:cytochrome c-type biogenesis protein CcmH [Gammaproteobacteria bacterium]